MQHFLEIASAPAEREGQGGGRWVHPKGANSMAASGLSCRKPLVGTGWAFLALKGQPLAKNRDY